MKIKQKKSLYLMNTQDIPLPSTSSNNLLRLPTLSNSHSHDTTTTTIICKFHYLKEEISDFFVVFLFFFFFSSRH